MTIDPKKIRKTIIDKKRCPFCDRPVTDRSGFLDCLTRKGCKPCGVTYHIGTDKFGYFKEYITIGDTRWLLDFRGARP